MVDILPGPEGLGLHAANEMSADRAAVIRHRREELLRRARARMGEEVTRADPTVYDRLKAAEDALAELRAGITSVLEATGSEDEPPRPKLTVIRGGRVS